MIHARSCGQLAHNDIEFDLLRKVCLQNGVELDTAIFQFKAEKETPPLSWHLTNRQKKAIDLGWEQVDPEGCDKLRRFLQNTRDNMQARAGS